MSLEYNKELVRRYLEALSGKRKTREIIDKYVTDQELIDHILSSEVAFPEYRLDIEEMVAEGELVSVRGTVSGVNRGPLKDMPATNREVSFAIFVTYRVVNDKVVEHWMLTDDLAWMKQLGLVPSPSESAPATK